jgi:hypothetical protein
MFLTSDLYTTRPLIAMSEDTSQSTPAILHGQKKILVFAREAGYLSASPTREATMAEAKKLFDRVVEVCGLSPVFAKNSLTRAIKRCGFSPETLTKEELAKCLPEIRNMLKLYLSETLEASFANITALTKKE